MKRLFPLLLILAVAGCGKITVPVKDQLAKCMTKITPPAQPFADVSDHDRRYMIACMRLGGYTFDNLLGDCNRQIAPTILLRCYKPTGQK